jgi:hypothetical protein
MCANFKESYVQGADCLPLRSVAAFPEESTTVANFPIDIILLTVNLGKMAFWCHPIHLKRLVHFCLSALGSNKQHAYFDHSLIVSHFSI